jgi:hypothetical protein
MARDKLPDYITPAQWVRLHAVPVTAKVNLACLPCPSPTRLS